MHCTLCTILLLVASGAVWADLSAEFQPVDNSGCAEVAGYTTQDLLIHTDTDWLTAQIILTVDNPGDIYQDAYGSEQSPNPAWFPIVPSLEFDTYISNGVLGESCNTIPPTGLGGTQLIFDETQLSIGWYTSSTDEIGDLNLARITMAETATGTWDFQVTAAPAPGPKVVTGGRIIDGIIYLGGDRNTDGFVGQTDLDIILGSWGSTAEPNSRPDPSGDGFVGQNDLDIVLRDWGYGFISIGGQAGQIPEPVAITILAVAGLSLVGRKKHHTQQAVY